eukprot:CAMPEP_0184225650 /NCGR_PEP_ID=MMETSP0976-20121227/20352_1 /TAXON_ID=483370 /ORGANISM="non described non described, Strain CCMP2097" /LENGTH=37 /DNA_ID= /DNA_START= /DNA_END= /DNA_ORIENTATION=
MSSSLGVLVELALLLGGGCGWRLAHHVVALGVLVELA